MSLIPICWLHGGELRSLDSRVSSFPAIAVGCLQQIKRKVYNPLGIKQQVNTVKDAQVNKVQHLTVKGAKYSLRSRSPAPLSTDAGGGETPAVGLLWRKSSVRT